MSARGRFVLRGQDTDSSDLDILVDPTLATTLFDIGAIRYEFGKLLSVQVDVLTSNALPDSFRVLVLAEARPRRPATSSASPTATASFPEPRRQLLRCSRQQGYIHAHSRK